MGGRGGLERGAGGMGGGGHDCGQMISRKLVP